MIVLGIDSSTDKLAVGLADERGIMADKALTVPRQHGSRIIGLINQTLAESGADREDLRGVAVAIGPGSFTGLRVGLATAKGLALGLKIPIVGISTFEVLARRLRSEYPNFCLAVPARQEEFYFCRIGARATAELKIELVSEYNLIEQVGALPVGFVTVLPGHIERGKLEMISPEKLVISAGELAQVGVERIAAGQADDLALLEPLYFAPAQAERRFSGH